MLCEKIQRLRKPLMAMHPT